MTAPLSPYLSYPRRAHGMDHSWYAWRPPADRPSIRWPGGARVALVVVLPLQWFPLDMAASPIRVPGGLTRPYPDIGMYSLRDYGTRVGVFRVLDVLDELGVRASVPINAAVAERHPRLVEEVQRRGWEVLGHGIDMGTPHHSGLSIEQERGQLAAALEVLAQRVSGPVTGWLSPGRSESMDTLPLLAEAGLRYVCDWPNDERPYLMTTPAGPLTALPVSNEIDDHTILVELRHSEPAFAQQVIAQHRRLHAEASAADGRLMTLTVHPWIIGQPHRIGQLRAALEAITDAGVWSATAAEVVSVFHQATDPPSPTP